MNAPVLVVEDNQALATMLRALLEQEGFAVDVARTGHQALELAAQRAPAAAIVDIGLPGLTGTSVATALRCGRRNLPLIVLSALPPRTVAEAARACGAVACFTKPFETEGLIEALHAAVRGAPAAP